MSSVAPKLKYCVWEITLACNAKCLHCGSSAGAPRTQELTTDEALRLIHDLSELGCQSVTLSGGEPLLRSDWPELAQAVIRNRMRPELISNGLMAADQADKIAAAGFYAVTFSVDGPDQIHDHLRGIPDALRRLRKGAQALLKRGVRLGATTQVNRLNLNELDAIRKLLQADGFSGWQIQLTRARGRAAQMASLCLRPEELPVLEAAILSCQQNSDLFIQASDSIGYMSRNEPRLRSGAKHEHSQVFTGCHAGLQVVGVTSEGTIRGCLSLPNAFDEGNIRQRPLSEIWHDPNAFSYNRHFEPSILKGTCAGCAFKAICRGGCSGLAYAATGAVTENPYCLHGLTREGGPSK